jgi:hypothetical protein
MECLRECLRFMCGLRFARRFRRGLKAKPAVGKLRFAERRALRRGAFFRPLRDRVVLRRVAIVFPFCVDERGLTPTIAKCGFSINGSPP